MSTAQFVSNFSGRNIIAFKDIVTTPGTPGLRAPRVQQLWGQDVFGLNLDFHDEPVVSSELARWTTTKVQAGAGSSSFALLAGQGGLAKITTDNAINDGINTQFGVGSFKLTTSAYLYFLADFEVDEVTDSEYFIGLALVETNILGAPATDLIGFKKDASSTDIDAILRKASTDTTLDGIATQDADTRHKLEFEFDGPNRRVYYWVDGNPTATNMTSFANIPSTVLLVPSIHYRTKETTAHTMTIDTIKVWQDGRL